MTIIRDNFDFVYSKSKTRASLIIYNQIKSSLGDCAIYFTAIKLNSRLRIILVTDTIHEWKRRRRWKCNHQWKLLLCTYHPGNISSNGIRHIIHLLHATNLLPSRPPLRPPTTLRSRPRSLGAATPAAAAGEYLQLYQRHHQPLPLLRAQLREHLELSRHIIR